MVAFLSNLATNPQPKTVDTGWSRSDGAGTSTFTRVATGFDSTADAFMVLEFTAVSGAVEGWVRYAHPVSAGDLLSAAVEVISSRAQMLTPTVTFVDGSANVLEVFYGADVTAAAATRVRVGVSNMTAPTGAVEAWITAAVSLEAGTAPQVGDTFQVSRAIVAESLSVPTYGDGSYANWYWLGADWVSASEGVADSTPVLVAHSDWAPVPRVQFTFPTLHPLASRITVFRQSDGRTWKVRDSINKFAVGGFGNLDFEAPNGVQSTYRAMQFDPDGVELGYTDSASVTLTFEGVCVHQPLDPTLNARVDFREQATKDLVRSTPGAVSYPQGSRLGRYIGSGDRRGLAGVNLSVATDTLEQATALDAIWGTYDEPQLPVVCIRSAPPTRIPRTLFAWVPEPHEQEQTLHYDGELIFWELVGTEVQPPAEGLVVPILTYDDLDVSYTTYDDRDSAYVTYLAMDTDYTLAGAADA